MNIGQKQNKNTFPDSIYTFKAEELNQIVNELQYIITAGGLTPDNADTTQVLQSLRLIFGGVEALTGIYIPYGGDILPEGWLWCDGSALVRADYTELFARIGTKFGQGDGSTTFNIPDFTGGRFIEGDSLAGTYKDAGLPNIKGSLTENYVTNNSIASGAFSQSTPVRHHLDANDNPFYIATLSFNANDGVVSAASGIYSDNVITVQPKSLTSRWIIKY